MKIDGPKFLPVGMDFYGELKGVVAGGLSAVVYSALAFLPRYFDKRQALFVPNGPLRSDARMDAFEVCMEFVPAGFLVLAIAMMGLAIYHYSWHFRGSRSIYLMKRLPHRWELARRCLAIPLSGIVLSGLLAAATTGLYYLIYRFCTPVQALTI